ncbi:MAG: NTP transferase domain-containing protein [Parcubacteria group bacterium]|nr:NTP transferase domain-containing protein [Parcubacteria group bacterium]
MQAVILAAGEGTRLRPLTDKIPKALVSVVGKPILEHTLLRLPEEITEVIIITGYKGESIKDRFGDAHQLRRIRYVENVAPKGTGYALAAARPYISGPFLLLNGDDIYGENDLRLIISEGPAILATESETPERFGVCEVSGNVLCGIIEKPSRPPSNLVNIGAYFLTEEIFNIPIKKLPNGEWNLAEQVGDFAKQRPVLVHRAELWCPINTIAELKRAEEVLACAYAT